MPKRQYMQIRRKYISVHNGVDSLTLPLFPIMAPLRSLRGSIKNVFEESKLKDRDTREAKKEKNQRKKLRKD